jgi:hypothetical protein
MRAMMKKLIISWVASVFMLISSISTATQLGQINVQHPVLGQQTVTYEALNGYAVAEGDVLLGLLKPSSALMQASVIKLDARRWPSGIVPYEFDEQLPWKNKEDVLSAIERWQRVTHVIFMPLTAENRALYNDYVVFVPEAGRLCASFVGRQGGRQVVQLSTRCDVMTTVHEIGHVLGLWHEQSRLDRDQYIRILWENIEEQSKYNFEQHLTDGIDHDAYDYQSVMHYSAHAFSKNGKETIVPLQEGAVIGQRKDISPLDKAAVNAMYPGPQIEKTDPLP